MKELSIIDIQQALAENITAIKDCNVINLGIFTLGYSFFDEDVELYAVFTDSSDFNSSYNNLSHLIEKVFSGYQISIYTERDADNLNQSIFDAMIFCM